MTSPPKTTKSAKGIPLALEHARIAGTFPATRRQNGKGFGGETAGCSAAFTQNRWSIAAARHMEEDFSLHSGG